MRTIYNHFVLSVILAMILVSSASLHAQTYGQTLETVWISDATSQKTLEMVSVTNQHILSKDAFKLNKEIRKAKQHVRDNNVIEDRKRNELTTYRYLKTLKQGQTLAIHNVVCSATKCMACEVEIKKDEGLLFCGDCGM